MSDAHTLTVENIMTAYPSVLIRDRNLRALGEAICRAMVRMLAETDLARIYAAIDTLPEELLDILAYDFKVDWWDADYSLEEKRQTLKDSWQVHRTLGTPAAVLSAISAIYPETQIQEWWEYDGEPYHFRLMIDTTYERADPEKHARVLERVQYYKNLRSVLDEIEYFDAGGEAVEYAGAAVIGEEIVDSAEAVRY